MSPRQKRLYKYTVDIWSQRDLASAGAEFGLYSKRLSSVKCSFQSTPETDEATDVGRNKQVNIFTMDHFLFESSVTINDTDYITMTDGPNSTQDVGSWWAVQGNTQYWAYRAKSQMVYGKKSEKPAGA